MELFKSSCKNDKGVGVPTEQTRKNGCEECIEIRSICATSCNYCEIHNDAPSTTKRSTSGIRIIVKQS